MPNKVMKRILVTGATGQIGSELIPELRRIHGSENVVVGVHRTPRDGRRYQKGDH